jgi:hypothetical protein
MSKKATDEAIIDDTLKELGKWLKDETDNEVRLKIVDRQLKALALKKALKSDDHGKAFDLGSDE